MGVLFHGAVFFFSNDLSCFVKWSPLLHSISLLKYTPTHLKWAEPFKMIKMELNQQSARVDYDLRLVRERVRKKQKEK